MRKKFDEAAAEAFANIDDIQSASYHYLVDGFDAYNKLILYKYFQQQLCNRNCKSKYINQLVGTALLELTYPVEKASKTYAWSARQRSACCGIPKSTWSRNQLCKHVNFIIDTIRSNADTVSRAIYLQLESDE